MLKRIIFTLALLQTFILVSASSESTISPATDPDVQSLDATSTNQRPVAGFIMKTWPAIIGVVLYGISGILHWTHFFRIGQRYMLTLTIGMTCMTTGLIFRIVCSHSPYSLGLYIIEDMFVLLSPCAFLATDYMILSRLANSLGRDIADDCLLIPAHRITKMFVWSDVTTFWIQAAGGGLSASASQAMSKTGTDIAMAGLILQAISFGLFTVLLIAFGFKVRSKYPRAWDINVNSQKESFFSVMGPFKTSPVSSWKILYFTVCSTCVGVLIRSIFRIAEFAGGYSGFLATHEGYFYCLDALPLWLAMSWYCFIWPTRFIESGSDRGSYEVPLAESRKRGNRRK
jgi:hypothetical protein